MRSLFLFCWFSFFLMTVSQATIRTVSNSAAFPGQFSNINAAIAASSNGDTIYIMPSATGYAAATLDKQLVLIGSGLNPQRPSHLGTGMPSLAMTTAASGSSIMGILFWSGCVWGDESNYVNNLYIAECHFTDLYIYSNNLIIENSLFVGLIFTGYSNSNNIFQNNIFNTGMVLRPPSNAIVRNNIFASNDVNNFALMQGPGGEFMGPGVQILNNIFYKNNPGFVTYASCTFIKNIYYLTNNPIPTNATSSGNLNVNPLFVNFPAAGSNFNWQNDYHLQAGSPGINYGTDGRDLGMWGGQVPVNAGFEPPVPRIYDLTANSNTVPVGGTLQLTIKATKAQ